MDHSGSISAIFAGLFGGGVFTVLAGELSTPTLGALENPVYAMAVKDMATKGDFSRLEARLSAIKDRVGRLETNGHGK